MKKYFILAAAALAFAACTNKEDFVAEPQLAEQQVGEVPVAFDSYVNRATTRAGHKGVINNASTLKSTEGFGVFAFYTDADSYDQSSTPNFFYNQNVEWDGGSSVWKYEPVKYWPNEFGTNALSDDQDRISFFAYAPYVEVKAATGKLATITDKKEDTWGIVGMKNNSATGDPMVKYVSTFWTDMQVDLLWGTVPSGSETWNLKNTGDQTLTAGKPWLNVKHPYKTSTDWASAQKVTFNFKHALASLNIQVDTEADATSAQSPADGTKVFVRSVTFEGFDTKGALDLNNENADEALWYNFDCLAELNNGAETIIKDGRKDGKEGLTAATKEYAAINPILVQSDVWDLTTLGVTEVARNLFSKADGTAASPGSKIYVIPNGDPLKITIEYDVLTKDDNLAGILNDGETHGSVVKNVITRYIGATGTGGSVSSGSFILENGKAYTVKLHLGLNSVQFDATVTSWENVAGEGEADLPHNNS